MSSFMTIQISYRFSEDATNQWLSQYVSQHYLNPIRNIGLRGICGSIASSLIQPMRTVRRLCGASYRFYETFLKARDGESRSLGREKRDAVDRTFIFLTWKMIARKLHLSDDEINMQEIFDIDQWVAEHPEQMETIKELSFSVKDAPLYLPALQRFPMPNLETIKYSGKFHFGHLFGVDTFADNWPCFKTLMLTHDGIYNLIETRGSDLYSITKVSHEVARNRFANVQDFKRAIKEVFERCIRETQQIERCPETIFADVLKAKVKRTICDRVFEYGEAAILYAFTAISLCYLKSHFFPA